MDAAGQKYDLVIYPDTRHGFTNPEATQNGKKFGLPLEYNPEVDRASWARLEALLTTVWPPR
jgi:dienelactone hydrolase